MRELTDSYCERCGTRYTFGSTPTKGPSLSGARLLAMGLKNFVMTDGTSMDEAMAAARIDVTKDESSRVTEEFHRTFNFCMTCRQYACDRCWNENQGACLSCAPLWDQAPVASGGRLLVRTPVASHDLEEVGKAHSLADLAPRPTDPADAVPWPTEDPLPGRPTPSDDDTGHRPVETPPTIPVAQASPWPPVPTRSTAEPPILEPPIPEPPAQPQLAARTQPRPRLQQPRPSDRVLEEERSAARQLQAQSQAWKSPDDGWNLWPLNGEPATGEMTLTPQELQLVEAQLSHTPPHDEPEVPPALAAPSDAKAFTPSHTLDEDAARVTEPEPGVRTQPQRPIPGAWEPETPAPRKAPSSDFDLLGSLRQPIELPQLAADSEPRRAPVIGRLLGPRAPAAPEFHKAAPQAPRRPRPDRTPRQKNTGPADPWPVATRWVDRSIEPHDWWADTDSTPIDHEPPVDALPDETAAEVENQIPAAHEPVAFATPEPQPEPHHKPEPVRANDVVAEPAAPAQQPLFTMPPATTDRWAAAKPDLPARIPVEWPASDPLDEKSPPPSTPAPQRLAEPAPAAAKHAEEAAPWPPIGASWPAPARPASPWPAPQGAFVPASVVAAAQAEMSESPLVTALWAESAQQVLDRGSVRVCHRCALPVSTQARYCRRCGTHQG
jgi:ribosomal protein L40E